MIDKIEVSPVSDIDVSLDIPGDKSVSHRSVIFGSLAQGNTTVTNYLQSDDCLHTVDCFRKMGISIEHDSSKKELLIEGKGLYGLTPPNENLDVGNSGTAIRLLLGILSAQKFDSIISGDHSIQSRPMGRVTKPLSQMGAQFDPMDLAPINVKGSNSLKGIKYDMPVASAQVKSAVLLAGLYAKGQTTVVEPRPSRDHTERMMRKFGVDVTIKGSDISINGEASLKSPGQVDVPSDISSAAFFLVAGCIIPNAKIEIKNIGMNPTRNGIVTVLQKMGANISISNMRNEEFEPVADITVRSSLLKGIEINGDIIPNIIDEIPVICVAAACAQGTTTISEAAELKVKESNRIDTTVSELQKFGVDIKATDDGMIVKGGKDYVGDIFCDSHGDHRIAMSCAILGCVSSGKTVVNDVNCINTSFPEFFELFKKLQG